MKLEIDKVKEKQQEIISLKHKKLLSIVDLLRDGNARLKNGELPNKGGIYVFWWTGDKSILREVNVNRKLLFKGPNQRKVNITMTDEWIFHRGENEYIPLYVGKTADSISKRIGLHLQLKTMRILENGENAITQKRKTTSNQVRDRIDRMFLFEKDTRSLMLNNIGLSYIVLHGDDESVNRFYLEDRLIGDLFPIFNVDIER